MKFLGLSLFALFTLQATAQKVETVSEVSTSIEVLVGIGETRTYELDTSLNHMSAGGLVNLAGDGLVLSRNGILYKCMWNEIGQLISDVKFNQVQPDGKAKQSVIPASTKDLNIFVYTQCDENGRPLQTIRFTIEKEIPYVDPAWKVIGTGSVFMKCMNEGAEPEFFRFGKVAYLGDKGENKLVGWVYGKRGTEPKEYDLTGKTCYMIGK